MSLRNQLQFPFAKYPAVRVALLLVGGIALSKVISIDIYCWGGLFGLVIIGWIAAEIFFSKKLAPYYNHIAVGCYLAGLISFGGLWQTMFNQQRPPDSARLLSAYTWKSIEVKGRVKNIAQRSSGKCQLIIAVDSTVIADSLRWLEPYRLSAVYDPAKKPLPKSMEMGAVIDVQATVYPLEGKRNPHEFDYKAYLASRHIYAQAGITNIYRVHQTHRWLSWDTWRRVTLHLIEYNFSKQTAPIAKAILLGYKNDLQYKQKEAFAHVGLSHIMAVSGLHVGFIIAPFWFFIPFFWRFRRGKQVGLLLLVILLFFYAGLTGFSATVIRASITGGLIAFGRLFYKSGNTKNLTAIAAVIILLLDPNELFDISFQLSFAAVYIILLLIPVVRRYLPQKIRQRWYGTLVMVVIVSAIVQFGLYPLLSYYFGTFSLVAPFSNAAVVPALAFVVPYALILLPFSFFFPSAGYIMNTPCRWFLEYMQWFVSTAAHWNWSWIYTSAPGLLLFLIWLTAIFLLASLPFAKIRWKLLILLLLLVGGRQAVKMRQTFEPPLLEITMLDVGQGDAAFIHTPSGKNMMIDTGRWTLGYNSGRSVILPYLKAMGVHKLDAIFLSHPHADHIGGMIALIKHMPIDTIYNSGFTYDSKLYHRYIALAHKKHIPIKSLSAGDRIPIDRAMRIFVYGPDRYSQYADINQHSLVLGLIYGEKQFLFMGDAGRAEEKLLLHHYGRMIDTDFLKVAHHGSGTSASAAFLRTASPAYSAVSLAWHNRYHFPNPGAVRRLLRTNTKLYFTSLSGALQFYSNGRSIKREKWR